MYLPPLLYYVFPLYFIPSFYYLYFHITRLEMLHQIKLRVAARQVQRRQQRKEAGSALRHLNQLADDVAEYEGYYLDAHYGQDGNQMHESRDWRGRAVSGRG